jgi:hypothetical protein
MILPSRCTGRRSATACVPHDGRLLRASRTTVGYCVRPARRSATACVPHEGRLLRASRTTVGLRLWGLAFE